MFTWLLIIKKILYPIEIQALKADHVTVYKVSRSEFEVTLCLFRNNDNQMRNLPSNVCSRFSKKRKTFRFCKNVFINLVLFSGRRSHIKPKAVVVISYVERVMSILVECGKILICKGWTII